ncbi:MerR family transcriptional regulator, partial [Nonomuraea sp. LPB2021202275-12-8]|uniref:MerR family transcriptional regulator n=1 Tax=Nonomuraea sp. LPB2021202275-12-8 TaxID=3120159 RepID=UPI00300C033F
LVLPEPSRRANGYREYGIRDAVALARVRRLVELGLSLDEARDAVADDRTMELPGILTGIDADLALQEREIRARRSRAQAPAACRPDRVGPQRGGRRARGPARHLVSHPSSAARRSRTAAACGEPIAV